jgi:hypothetical protein
MSRLDAGPILNPAKYRPTLIGPRDAKRRGVARLLIIALLILTGCAAVRPDGTWAGNRDVGNILTVAKIVVEVATEVPADGPWCDGDPGDPPHTCPAQVRDPR